MNGIDAARKILENKDIPIVFLTGNASKEIFLELASVQAYGFVLKGTNEFSLLSTIEMALTLHGHLRYAVHRRACRGYGSERHLRYR